VLAVAALTPYLWHTWQGRRKGRQGLGTDQKVGG
jgi:hypothetical protein